MGWYGSSSFAGRKTIAEDGVFGPATNRAVRDYQSHKRLAADGIVGNNTWKNLCTMSSGAGYIDSSGRRVVIISQDTYRTFQLAGCSKYKFGFIYKVQ